MKTTFLIIILIFILILISNLHSQQIPYGRDFQVNTYFHDCQDAPKVAALANGGFVVCWESERHDGSGFGVFGQMFNASGYKFGDEFQINTYYQGDQVGPVVTGLTEGGFVVVWWSEEQDGSGYGIFGQLYDDLGNKIGEEFQINSYTQGWQDFPSVANLANGGFLVSWNSLDDSEWGVSGQIFDAFGNKINDEFRVNSYTQRVQGFPSAIGLFDSGFVICWQSENQDGSGCGIFGQLYNEIGDKRGSEFQVNIYTQNNQGHPEIDNLAVNGFVICWESEEQDGSEYGVFSQIFDSTSTKIDDEFQVNTYTQNVQGDPTISTLSNGKFVVCWSSWLQDGSDFGIFGQQFDYLGNKINKEFRVNNYKQNYQGEPTIAGLLNGSFIVCWTSKDQDGSGYGIFGKLFPNEPLIHQLKEYSLLAPQNDLTINTTSPIFHWRQPSAIIECYPWEITFDLYLDTDFDFPHPQIIKNIEDTTYTIDSLAAGKTYFWKVLAKNLAGDSLWSSQQDWGFFIKPGATLVENADNGMPKNFELFQNYPNPFNSSTEIRYSIPQTSSSQHALIRIYDIRGRLVKVLVDQDQSGGIHTVSWDGLDMNGNGVSSGIYFYTLQTGSYKRTKKTLLLE